MQSGMLQTTGPEDPLDEWTNAKVEAVTTVKKRRPARDPIRNADRGGGVDSRSSAVLDSGKPSTPEKPPEGTVTGKLESRN
jgi:hypothetical protein